MSEATDDVPLALIRQHPTITNPHVRMCAAITAVMTPRWPEAEPVLREVYRDLGHHTGRYMVDTGVVASGADLETYGRVSEQIMDACGFEGWRRLTTDASEHRTAVPGCAAYVPFFHGIGAPKNLCEIPFEWDNGCLDVINPDLRIAPERCAYRGAGECHYVIRSSGAGGRAAPAEKVGTAIVDAPVWTNPYAGLLAILGRCLGRLSPSPADELRAAMHTLGVYTGQQLMAAGAVGADDGAGGVARVYAAIQVLSGYSAVQVRDGEHDSAVVEMTDPFAPVTRTFGQAAAVFDIATAWHRAWISTVNPSLELSFAGPRDDAIQVTIESGLLAR
jgi:hypothetical protein